MENLNEERLIPDHLKKMEKLANPLKGTPMGAMLENQKKNGAGFKSIKRKFI